MGYGQTVVQTEWTEDGVEEAEELLELPHPIPERPEISPSFVIENTSRLDEPGELTDEVNMDDISRDDDDNY